MPSSILFQLSAVLYVRTVEPVAARVFAPVRQLGVALDAQHVSTDCFDEHKLL